MTSILIDRELSTSAPFRRSNDTTPNARGHPLLWNKKFEICEIHFNIYKNKKNFPKQVSKKGDLLKTFFFTLDDKHDNVN